MGLLNWLINLTQKRYVDPDRESKPRRSVVVHDLTQPLPEGAFDNGFIVVKDGDRTILMDRMSYEYEYGPKKPDPTQKSLDEMLVKSTCVKVFDAGMKGDVLTSLILFFEEQDPAGLEALRCVLRVSEEPNTFSHCYCLGGPTIEFLDESGHRLALVGMQHGHAIRWNQWRHDAQIIDMKGFVNWFTERGIAVDDILD